MLLLTYFFTLSFFIVRCKSSINVKENGRDNHEWTIHRNWQFWAQDTDRRGDIQKNHRKLPRWATRTPQKNGWGQVRAKGC